MTELVVSDNPVNNAISDGMYSSFPVQTFDDRKNLFKVVSNASRLGDNIGKVINVKHLVIQPVELIDRITNEPIDGHRIVLIDDKGESYVATSKGLVNAVRNLLFVMGDPSTWEKPIPMKVVSEKAAMGNYFTLQLAD